MQAEGPRSRQARPFSFFFIVVGACKDLAVHRVFDGDVGVDFNGLAVEDGGAVAPLSDGVERGLVEERIAANDLQGLNGAVGGDDGAEFDVAAAAHLFWQSGVDGLDAPDEHGWSKLGREAHGPCWNSFVGPLRLKARVVHID